MPSRLLTDLDPTLEPIARKFLSACAAEKLGVFISCTYRSNAEQTALYAQGRTAPGGIVTGAKAGQSPHNCVTAAGKPAAKAFDIAITGADGALNWNSKSAAWTRAGAIGVALGLEWGGLFKGFVDSPHFQLKGWTK